MLVEGSALHRWPSLQMVHTSWQAATRSMCACMTLQSASFSGAFRSLTTAGVCHKLRYFSFACALRIPSSYWIVAPQNIKGVQHSDCVVTGLLGGQPANLPDWA